MDKVEKITGLVSAFSALCEIWDVPEKDRVVAARVFCFTLEESERYGHALGNDQENAKRVGLAMRQMILDAYK